MRLLNRKISNSIDVELRQLTEKDEGRILEGYTLLRDAMVEHLVEDVESFRGTVSTATDSAVVPKIVCALYRDEMIGIAIGSYLRTLRVGFMCYGAVAAEWRRRGIYSAVRGRLIDLLSQETNGDGLQFVISELAEDSRLFQQYVIAWNAFVLPCDYEQPGVQGLQITPLKLVAQPVDRRTSPDEEEVITIVNEIYSRIYRISNVAENDSYRRIVASMQRSSPSASPVVA